MKRNKSIWEHLYSVPHRLGWVDAGGVRTRYLEAGSGSGPALLLLHGTAGSLENFCANYEAFALHFRVIGIDMLGCGLTDKPDFDYHIKDYVAHAKSVLDALEIKRAAVVGVSLGSWVGAALALAHPSLVSRLVMVAPAGIVIDAEEERQFAEGVRKRRSAAANAPTWESVQAAMNGLMLDPASLGDDLVAIRLSIYSQPAMAATMPHLLAFSLGGQALTEAQWRSLSLPIQVFAAVDANNMFLRNAQAIAGLAPNAEQIEIHGCDHWAQYEQPVAFNSASLAFLTRP